MWNASGDGAPSRACHGPWPPLHAVSEVVGSRSRVLHIACFVKSSQGQPRDTLHTGSRSRSSVQAWTGQTSCGLSFHTWSLMWSSTSRVFAHLATGQTASSSVAHLGLCETRPWYIHMWIVEYGFGAHRGCTPTRVRTPLHVSVCGMPRRQCHTLQTILRFFDSFAGSALPEHEARRGRLFGSCCNVTKVF